MARITNNPMQTYFFVGLAGVYFDDPAPQSSLHLGLQLLQARGGQSPKHPWPWVCPIRFKLRGAKLGFPAIPIVARMHCPSGHQVVTCATCHDAAECPGAELDSGCENSTSLERTTHDVIFEGSSDKKKAVGDDSAPIRTNQTDIPQDRKLKLLNARCEIFG